MSENRGVAAVDNKLILIDEPTGGIDSANSLIIGSYLRDDSIGAELIGHSKREEGNGLGQRAILIIRAHCLNDDISLGIHCLSCGLVDVCGLVVEC